MASATRKTVEKTITEDVIVLELTQDEASALHALVDRHGDIDLTEVLLALDAPAETDDRPIQVGDKVRITAVGEGDDVYLHRIGTVGDIDFDDVPYRVAFTDGDWAWVKSVERVND